MCGVSGEEALQYILSILRRVKALLAEARLSAQLAHDILVAEGLAKRLGLYDEVAEEIEEVKSLYLALFYAESMTPRASHEQRFQRRRRSARWAARLGRLGA